MPSWWYRASSKPLTISLRRLASDGNMLRLISQYSSSSLIFKAVNAWIYLIRDLLQDFKLDCKCEIWHWLELHAGLPFLYDNFNQRIELSKFDWVIILDSSSSQNISREEEYHIFENCRANWQIYRHQINLRRQLWRFDVSLSQIPYCICLFW